MKTLARRNWFYWMLFLVGSISTLPAQSIEVKQSDKIKTDGGTVGKANPGDVIQYKVNIQNTGGANATGVQLNAVPDTKTTFVNGSFVSTSIAVNDAYTCTGNVGINVPLVNGVLINDFDDNLGGATLTCNTCNPTTNGGTVTLNNDGSFMYIPAAGFTGMDQFTYTINDATIPDGAMPIAGDITATVTITISNMIWFIDNSSVVALSDGRRNSPFKTLAAFEAVNGNGGLNPAAGHTIYIEHTGTNYSGGVTLENNQILIGEGHTGGANLANVLSFALAAHSLTLPNINGTRPVIENAGGDGVTLAMNNNLRGFNVGNTPAADAGVIGNGIGTLVINEVSINGTGQILSLNNGTVNATFNELSTTSTTQTAIVLSNLAGSVTDVDGSGSSISGASGGFSITGPAFTSTVSLTFNGDATHAGANPLVQVQNHATGTVNFQNGTLSSTAGSINFTNADGTYNFNGTTTLSGAPRITIDGGSSGMFNFNSNTSVTNPTNVAFDVDGSNAIVDYNGTLSSNTAFNLIDITNNTGGSASFDGNLTFTGNATGIRVQSNTSGTYSFNGSSKSISSGANTALNLSTNTGATINFTNGGLAITTTSGMGFSATGGGTVTVQGSANTISSTTGTALNVASTTIGASNLNFQSISSNGATNGIVLNSTGTNGGLVVTGTGAAGTGGTIRNGTIGISLTSTRNVSLAWMQLNDFSDYAIRGNLVVNFTLDNTVVNGVNGNNAAADEGSIRFNELTGSATISNCNLSGGFEDNFRLGNSSGTLNRITFSNTTIGANSTTDGNDGITIESTNSAIINVSVLNSFFISSRGDLFQLNLLNTSTMDLIFTGNTLSNNHPGIATGGGGVTISGGDNTGTGVNLTFNIANNTFRDADGHGILIVKSTDPGTFSGTFNNNQIGVQATADSGSKAGSGIKIQNAGLGAMTVAVTDNTIRQYNNFGIELLTGGGAMALSGNLNATVTGNTVANPGTGGLPMNGIHLNGGTVPGDTYQICTQISGNSITGSGANGGTDFRLRQRQATTVRLPGYGGANNNDVAVVTFVAGMNGGASGLASNNVPTGGGFVGGAACNMP